MLAPELPQFDAEALGQLLMMGFPEIRCQKALLATGNSNADMALNWLLNHSEDPGNVLYYLSLRHIAKILYDRY